jgi:hypothetical protein
MTAEIKEMCPCCNHELIHYPGMREPTCSEFCITQSDENKTAWKNLKPGDFGIFPCSRCGCAIQDEYGAEDNVCSGCYPKLRLERFEAALKDIVSNVPFNTAVDSGLSEARCKEIWKLAKGDSQ